uniref:DUF4220 domain-containing protein n=1 Tax=Setaria viridis TaxID=4556 RepID=A0A4U6VL46_SETVI|nr:hypothetical protein SEVIR_3G090700v2 [Setaria viridis]
MVSGQATSGSPSHRRPLGPGVPLFITGFLSFCEKPWALYRARINRLAAVAAMLEEQSKKKWWSFCFSELDKLVASSDDLNQRLKPLDPGADVSWWLRNAFGLIYTRANVVTTPVYMAYHLLLLPSLHTAAIALFATIPKHGYEGTDVRMTYILMCLTAALDLLAAFIRVLLHLILFCAGVPALCETIPEYNLVTSVLRRMRPRTGWLLKCATKINLISEEFFEFRRPELYGMVIGFFAIDLVKVALGKSFSEGSTNWALGDDLTRECGTMIKRSLRASFDRSVLIWHIATDLCFRRLMTSQRLSEEQHDELSEEQRLRQLCTQAISNYMAHLLNFRADMLMTGSRQHLFSRASQHMERILEAAKDVRHKLLQGKQQPEDGDLRKIKDEAAKLADESGGRYTLIHDACNASSRRS